MTTRAIGRVVFAMFLLAGNARASLLTKQFQFKDPVIAGTPWGAIVTISGCRSIGSTGEPILPVYSTCFIIPRGEIVTRVSIESHYDVALDGSYDIAPMQPQAPLGAPAPRQTARDTSIYRSSAAFPAERVSLATEQTIAGLRLAFINIRPCAFIPKSGIVLFSPSIRVTVETAPSSAMPRRAPATLLRRAAREIRDRVANPELAVEYATMEEALTDTIAAAELVHYVIITSPDFATAFEPLADLKERFGMRTRIVDTEWIAANFDGSDEQEQIRNFITYAYENWSTEYVLLGGDDDIIPHRGLYVKNGTYIDADIPSDLYYACLDGNWNTDRDAYFGEPGEEDLLPEVIVGRLPVDSADEIANVIEKISSYELSPVSSQCTSAALLGELLWSEGGVDTWGGDYKDEILYGSSSWGFTTAGLPGGFDVTTLYDDDDGSWTGNQAISLLNEGVNLVNHCGHSSLFTVMRITPDDVALLTNDGIETSYCIIYSHGCYAAAFDNRDYSGTVHSEDCIGEDLVNGPHGSVAFIGNTRYGWDAPGSTCGVSQFFDRRFFDAIFGQDISFVGDALEDSRFDNIPYISFDAVRWVYYEMCLLGDPAMSIWTDAPRTLAAECDSVLLVAQQGFEVRVSDAAGPLPGALVRLNSTAPEVYCTAVTDESGVALMQPVLSTEGELLLSIVSPNHYLHTDTLYVEDTASYLCSLELTAVSDDSTNGAGDGDGIAEAGETVALTITLQNIGLNALNNVEINLANDETRLAVKDGEASAGAIAAGATAVLDRAFSIEIAASVPNATVAALEFTIAADEGTWKAIQTFTVSAPDIALESWTISDVANGDGDGCIEAWEFQNLTCTYRNNGVVDAIQPVLRLSFLGSPWGRPTKSVVAADGIPAGEAITFEGELQWFVSESTPPFSDIPMILALDGTNIPRHADTLIVRTCGYTLDDPADSAGPCTHAAIVGVDQWHVSTARYHSEPSSWKCGSTSGGVYANVMESALTLPPLCLGSNSQMTFWHRMTAEAGTTSPYWALDAGVVEISQDNGETWKIITPSVAYPSRASPYNTIFLAAYQRCFSGTIDWKMITFNLSAYSGPTLLRFHFASDEQYGYEGWYIDDICVSTDITTDTGTDGTPLYPYVTRLEAPYPNPFNPRTVIPFELGERGAVEIKIFDVAGRLVRTLVSGMYEKGRHAAAWNGRDNGGRPVASSVYFCRLKAGIYTATTRLTLLR
jgi:hypothetical protein